MQVVDQSWTHQRSNDPVGGWWALPLVFIVIILVMAAVEKKPWMLLALFAVLVIVIPVCSALFR